MSELLYYVAGFLACSALIIYSGSRLTKYGDLIADLAGMGKAWFGLIMMAAVTSLPELFTGVGSVMVIDAPDIAAGDIFGSCAFNLVILAILDYFVPGRPLSSLVTKSHVVAGFFGIIMVTFSILIIVFGEIIPVIGWFSSGSVAMIFLYLVSIRVIFKSEQKQNLQKPVVSKSELKGEISLRVAIKWYSFFALLVIAGALALPFFADHLAEEAGLSKSFVGTLLVATTTSLPELVVAIAAVRMGSMDIAVGNLLGSNIFNMLILALDDLLYRKGPLLAAVNPSHALSGLVTLVMTAVAGIGIMYSVPSKKYAFGIDALILMVLYIALLLALYQLG